MDTSGSGGMGMDIMREDPHIFMTPAEMMALFNDGGVDVGQLFSPEYIQLQQNQPQPDPRQVGVGQSPSGAFSNPAYLKLNGLVTSP